VPADRHLEHRFNRNTAFDVEWGFRREALLYVGALPMRANFHPLATEVRAWLRQEGQFSIFAEEHRAEHGAYTNPYTYHASALAAILAAAVNDSHAIASASGDADPMDIEIARVRSYNEQVLYVARLIEALIKQLLYCTQIAPMYYERASLEGLLSTECRGCQSANSKRHKLSLLGSLAHRYGLCRPFEACLFEHLKLVMRKRNSHAAHSESPLLNLRAPAVAREQLMNDSLEVGNECVHMLQHIAEIEQVMRAELKAAVVSGNVDGLSGPERQKGGESTFPDGMPEDIAGSHETPPST
jgi:hypothetical protein